MALKGLGTNLVPIGCVEYGDRQLSNKITYYDHLPQMELAVRRGDEAQFVDLISADAVCEGGKEYDKTRDLGMSIPSGARLIEFYLLREGALAPRHAKQELGFSAIQDTPIRMRVQQTPAQGQARLTIETAAPDVKKVRLTVSWARMEVLHDHNKDDIVAALERDVRALVPPVQAHPSHPFLWTFKPRSDELLNFSLAERVLRLNEIVDPTMSLPLDEVVATRKLLYRFQSPSVLTRFWGDDRHPSRIKARPISSEGDLPALGDGLTDEPLRAFDALLEKFAQCVDAEQVTQRERNQIVTFAAWAFTRCPRSIRQRLSDAACKLEVISVRNDFEAMGRAFESRDELASLFFVVQHFANEKGRLLDYHARALFNALSLRERAPEAMTVGQANDFVRLAIPAIELMISNGRYSRLMSICIKTIGGLIRYRLVDPSFLDIGEYLGDRVKKLLTKIMQRSQGFPKRQSIFELSGQVIEVLDRKSVSDTILQWPGENSDDNGDDE